MKRYLWVVERKAADEWEIHSMYRNQSAAQSRSEYMKSFGDTVRVVKYTPAE